MLCHNCGTELEENVLFCRECGAKVNSPKRLCRECGAKLSDGAKFCSECGAKVINLETGFIGTPDKSYADIYPSDSQDSCKIESTKKALHLSNPSQQINHNVRQPRKVRHSLKTNVDTKSQMLVLVLALIILSIFAFRIGGSSNKTTDKASDSSKKSTMLATNGTFDEIVPTVSETATLDPGAEYAYMADAWNVYIAKAVTEKVVKVESWYKTSQSDKSLKYRGDLGSFRIRDEENGFSWIDDTHTAFTFVVQDKNNSIVKKPTLAIFTVNISDSDKYKGTDYDARIACYTYVNDRWHTYRAIPLTDTLIKIECWYRTSAGTFDHHCFGWDVGIIDTDITSTDFEWSSDHGAFTITMKDPANDYEWKEEQLTSFILENKKRKYASVKDYLDGIKISDKD